MMNIELVKRILLLMVALLAPFELAAKETDYKAHPLIEDSKLKKVFHLFKKESRSGNVRSQYYLALMLLNGHGTKKDINKAIYWLEQAADGGDSKANYKLARMYHQPDASQEKLIDVFNKYSIAAAQGEPNAAFFLAGMYHTGIGAPKNAEKSLLLFQQAAQSGLKEAQFNLGVMYDAGDGVKHNPQLAMKWYKSAANQGHPRAQFNVGLRLISNNTNNHQEAYIWFSLAASGNHESAIKYRDLVAKALDQSELVDAQIRANTKFMKFNQRSQ